MAEQAEASFHKRYWFAEGGYLFDVVDGKTAMTGVSVRIRFSPCRWPLPILRAERWRPVVDVVSERLLTRFGLRTLSPDHPDYKATYAGDLRARDAAYHQGTVWPWFIGHYIDARLKVYQTRRRPGTYCAHSPTICTTPASGRSVKFLMRSRRFRPRGCIAQAWSVAEVLRAYFHSKVTNEA